MVRKYKKKSDRLKWSSENALQAVKDVIAGKKLCSAANQYGIPKSTLARKVEQFKNTEDVDKYDVKKSKINKNIVSLICKL